MNRKLPPAPPKLTQFLTHDKAFHPTTVTFHSPHGDRVDKIFHRLSTNIFAPAATLMYGPDFITRSSAVNQPDLFGPITCMHIGCSFNADPVTKEFKQCWTDLTAHYSAEPTHNPYSRSAFCHLLLSWLTTRTLQADRLLINATTFAKANDLVLKHMYLPPIPYDDPERCPAYPAVVATAHSKAFIHLQPLRYTHHC